MKKFDVYNVNHSIVSNMFGMLSQSYDVHVTIIFDGFCKDFGIVMQ